MEFVDNYFDINKVLDSYRDWINHLHEIRKINAEALKIDEKKIIDTYDTIVNFTRMWLSTAEEYNKVSEILSSLLKLIK